MRICLLFLALLVPTLGFSQGRTGVGPNPYTDGDSPRVDQFLAALNSYNSSCGRSFPELRNIDEFYDVYQLYHTLQNYAPKTQVECIQPQLPSAFKCLFKDKALRTALKELIESPYTVIELRNHYSRHKMPSRETAVEELLKSIDQILKQNEKE